ncbi:MAG: peptidylprolyl isomerase [Paracoccus sp. (in: a-proteobacteria)]|nr:peptidylprolyl isomerase [Paracoccus sp. (in: a-proteobacteria)]
MSKRSLAALFLAAPMMVAASFAQAQDAAPAEAPTEAPAAAQVEAQAPAATGQATADTVVATVNGVEITLGQMLTLNQNLPADMEGLPNQAKWDMMLDQLIRQTAMSIEGERQMNARDAAAIEIDRRAYLAGAALERVVLPEPGDDEVQAAYDAAFGGFEPATEYHASHILLETQEAAQAVIDELAGGADFATLAEERSTGPTGPTGGDLGWFTADRMVAPFAEAVVEMEPGATSSEPVQTQFGWHVIMLHDTRQTTPPDLAEVRPALDQQIRRARAEAEIARVTGEALVDKNEDLSPDLLDDRALLGVE